MKRTPEFDTFLVLFGMVALLCISPVGERIATIATMVIIGIPLAVIMLFIPGVFLFLLIARLVDLAFKKFGMDKWFVSMAISAGVMIGIPLLLNLPLDNMVTHLVSGDKNEITKPVKVDVLGVLYSEYNDKEGSCGEFCQRMLLSGIVKELIMLPQKMPLGKPADTMAGNSFELAHHKNCPNFDIGKGLPGFSVFREKKKWGFKTLKDVISLTKINGLCIIKTEATIKDADAVLLRGSIKKGKSQREAKYNPFADTVSAARISFFVREKGVLVERYRSTSVEIARVGPIFSTAYSWRRMDLHTVLWRIYLYVGKGNRYGLGPSLGRFLYQKLGYDLALEDHVARSDARRKIVNALNNSGEVSPRALLVIDRFFREFSEIRKKLKEDIPLSMRILADERVPIPLSGYVPVKNFADTDDVLAKNYASVLFSRMFSTNQKTHEIKLKPAGGQLENLSKAISYLPDETILPYRAELVWLAKDVRRRVFTYRALTKLKAFGADAIPIFLNLIDDAGKHSGSSVKLSINTRNPAWSRPYAAGVQGLCLMGAKARIAIPMIYDRLDSGIMVKHGLYWKLSINTLISIGADPNEMWAYLQDDSKYHNRSNFDATVRAARKKALCYN